MTSAPKTLSPAAGFRAAAGGLSCHAQELLARMLLSQAYRELGAIKMLREAQSKVATAQDRARLSQEIAEETRHLNGALEVWSNLTGAPTEALAAQAEQRLAEKPLPSINGPLDLAVAQFVFDRAGYFQLREYRQCVFEPYRQLVEPILREEAEHQDGGAREVVALAQLHPQEAQGSFETWLRLALLSFGRPNSSRNQEAVDLGLKARPSAAVMRDFVEDLRPTMIRAGLTFPAAASLDLDLPLDLF